MYMSLCGEKGSISKYFRKEIIVDMICRNYCGLRDLHILISIVAYKFGLA